MKQCSDRKILRLGGAGPVSMTTSTAHVDPPAPDLTPGALARSEEQSRRIEKALKNLPDQTSARIVRLHLIEGLSFVEIAKDLELVYEKVRRRFRAAVRQLKGDLRGWF